MSASWASVTESSATGKPESPSGTGSALAALDRLPGPALMVIAAVSYWALTYVGYAIPYQNNSSPFWPPAGIAVLLLIATSRPSRVPWVAAGIFAGEVASDLLHASPLLAALGYGAATFVYIPLAALIRRSGIYQRGLVNRVRDAVVFLVIAAAMGFANGAVALLVALAYGFGDYLTFYVTWSTGSLLGIVLITPLLVVWLGQPLRVVARRPTAREVTLLGLNLIAVVAAVAFLFAHSSVSSGPVGLLAPYVIGALILIAAWHGGPRAATVLLVVAAFGIALQTGAGRGPFAELTSNVLDALYVSQLAFGLLAVTILLVAAARAELSGAERRYRTLFEEAPGMYVVAQPAGGGPTLIDCNRRFLETLGLTLDEAVQHPLASFVSADSAKHLSNGDFARAMNGEFTPQERELVDRNGEVIPVLMQADPVVDESGKATGIRAMYMDLTDRRRAQRLEIENRLVRQQQLALLGNLTAGIAHEVRNPLNFVVNFAQANEELTDELSEVAQDWVKDPELEQILADLRFNAEAISRHGLRALDIMMAMLALSRDQAAPPEPVDVNEVVEKYSSLAYHGLRGRGIDVPAPVALELEPDLPQVSAAEADLGRVVLNLVSNACEAIVAAHSTARAAERRNGSEGTDPGERRQSSTGQQSFAPMVSVSTASTDSVIEIHIRDNGIGIPSDQLERIFEPFFTTKPAGEGTGLGLAISRDIVLQHGGELEVDSKPGEFTEFVVRLPRTRSPAASASAA